MRIPRRARFFVALVGFGVVLGAIGGVTYGAFFSTTSNSGNSFTSAADWTPPSASSSVIGKTPGYLAGQIKNSITYFVYANVSDSGNPPSGIGTVTADVSNITTGQTAVALAAGSYSVNGVSYNYRNAAALTSNAGLTAGAKTYTLNLTDNAANNQVQTGFSVTGDVTRPSGSGIQATNGGATGGKAEPGDVVTYTWNEQMEPNSYVAGWTGLTSQAVTVRVIDGGGVTNDTMQIWNAANGAQLNFGTVNLRNAGYVAGNVYFASAMTMAGNSITIVLGAQSGPGTTAQVVATANMTWTPVTGALDAAGNTCQTTGVTEGAPLDAEF
jgi:hypothetical protein